MFIDKITSTQVKYSLEKGDINGLLLSSKVRELISFKSQLVDSNADKYIYSNRGVYKITSPTYQQVEYIEATGTQYIDTGEKFNSNTDKFELSYQAADLRNYMIAAAGWHQNGKIWVYHYQGGHKFSVYITDTSGTQIEFFGFNGPDTSRHLVTYDAKRLSIDNILRSENTSYTFGESPTNFTLFTAIGSVSYYAKAKIYSFKIWKSGVLTRDMIPCYRKSDNVIGMYDVVNDVFYTNSGTGTFVKGADV